MVFHEIDSITDVVSGHRVIIYYIEGDTTNKVKLCKSVESIMEMLEKKNDDLIIFKVCQNTHHFNQFKELYKPEINGPIALFVINAEGIPLICEQIYEEDNVYEAFDSVCTYCKLNAVPKSDITKVINSETDETSADKTNTEILTNGQSRPVQDDCKMSSVYDSDLSMLNRGAESCKDGEEATHFVFTVLQIRLPDGSKEMQKFGKNALLQEVYDFVCNKFNLRDFDLKTYNRQVFSTTDYERTLKDLDLTPNGVVIVVYKNVVPKSTNNIISKLIQNGFWIVFAKTTSLFHYVQGLIYAFWNSFFSSGSRSGTRQIENQSQGSHTGGRKSTSSGVKRSDSRFGNIHTLRRTEDSDDENNRYNGNSTQQK